MIKPDELANSCDADTPSLACFDVTEAGEDWPGFPEPLGVLRGLDSFGE